MENNNMNVNKQSERGKFEDNLNDVLKKMLGNNAFNGNNMQVDKDFANLVKSIYYLATQLRFNMPSEDEEYYEIIKSTIEILEYDKN